MILNTWQASHVPFVNFLKEKSILTCVDGKVLTGYKKGWPVIVKKYQKGYTAGVFDLFHVGHLNILRRAKEQCEYLIVAVSTDELVKQYKNKTPVIPYDERKAIVEAIKYVNEVVPQTSRDKISAYERHRFDVMFVGDDWKGSNVFEEVDKYMRKRGGCVEYLPYTKNISSTLINAVLDKIYKSDINSTNG